MILHALRPEDRGHKNRILKKQTLKDQWIKQETSKTIGYEINNGSLKKIYNAIEERVMKGCSVGQKKLSKSRKIEVYLSIELASFGVAKA